MIRPACFRVNRASEVFRQEDRCDEMRALARNMAKLVKKGPNVQSAESDRLIKIVNWAKQEDTMQIRYELDAAIVEISNMQEIEKLVECSKGGGKMSYQVTKPTPTLSARVE